MKPDPAKTAAAISRIMSVSAEVLAKRAEAIERIGKVREEIAQREATEPPKPKPPKPERKAPLTLEERVARAEASRKRAKAREKARRKRWAAANPEKAKEQQRLKNQKMHARRDERLRTDPEYAQQYRATRQAYYEANKNKISAKRAAERAEYLALKAKASSDGTPQEDGEMSYTNRLTDENVLRSLELAVADRDKAREALQVVEDEMSHFVQHADKFMPGIEHQAIRADIESRIDKAVEQVQYAAKKWHQFNYEATKRGLV